MRDRLTGATRRMHKAMIYSIVTVLNCVCLFAAQAKDSPYNLVCFEQDGLTQGLDQVVSLQQFLGNDHSLQSGSCDFAQIPSGSSARYLGIHQSRNGFLYPLYCVRYATTGQRMFAADGIFQADQWGIRHKRGSAIPVITPATCGVLDSYLQSGARVPAYMTIPAVCMEDTIR